MGVECIDLVTRFAPGGSRVSRAWSEYEAAAAWHVGSGIGRGGSDGLRLSLHRQGMLTPYPATHRLTINSTVTVVIASRPALIP